MTFAQLALTRKPLVTAIVAMICIFLGYATLGRTFAIELQSAYVGEALAGFATALLLLLLLSRTALGRSIGVTSGPAHWGNRWWVPALAMTPIAAVNCLVDDVQWQALEFDLERLAHYALRVSNSGFFEEVSFRGAIFLILYSAWGGTRTGLQKAAATQALLFGLLHLTSLASRDLGYVAYQICFATLIGYGFAGLVAYARSLWPAIALHALFNAAGGIDYFFAADDYVFAPETLSTKVIVIGAFLVFGALPGYWCLKRAPLSNAEAPRPVTVATELSARARETRR